MDGICLSDSASEGTGAMPRGNDEVGLDVEEECKVPKETDKTHRLQQSHAQYSTYLTHRRPRPVIPRSACPVPCCPPDNASLEDKDSYAAFVLGNFASDRPHPGEQPDPMVPDYLPFNRPVHALTPPGTLWDRYLEWRSLAAGSPFVRAGLHVLVNMHDQRSSTERQGLRYAQHLQARKDMADSSSHPIAPDSEDEDYDGDHLVQDCPEDFIDVGVVPGSSLEDIMTTLATAECEY